jgi:hypothetical protein
MHPLVNNLGTLSDNELEQKIIELSRRYWTTSNPQVQAQMSMIIETYKLEQQERRSQQRKIEDENGENGKNGLDSLINVS